jgi:hypothetical protein
MEITKLTITPLFRELKPFYEHNPSKQIATVLIKDRLACLTNSDTPKVLKKIPKALRGFVKPDCRPIQNVDFYI